ncbi:MAG: hypothetical protein J6U63_03105, partial [Clostridia bacterium]|nr:hypothetical protein [Clostridia bacterium]
MKKADFEKGYSYEQIVEDFRQSNRREVSFTYNGIRETLCFIPVNGTDWQLTYLIRESVISARIDSISQDIVRKSFVQSLLTVAVLLVLFGLVAAQVKKNSRLVLEHNTAEAENRARQENLEKQLSLQAQLLEEQRHREELNKMVSALSSDFRGLYYIELDRDEAVCHRSHADLEGGGCVPGERFPYTASFADYAEKYVDPEHKEEFLRFVKPENVSEALKTSAVISYTYIVRRDGKETYETVRFAAIAMPEDKDGAVTKAGACFVDSDAETRNAMRQRQTLSDALAAAEEASRAKTAFLSNMSHEIRTPMNAIIGLNSIALKDPGLPEQTRDYLGQIGASAEHLLELINDILDMSRIESGRLTLRNEEFSFARLLEAVNTMFSAQCREKGLEYQCRLNSEIDVHYIGDNMKLRQVLINILGNAVKFTPAGGRVELQIAKKAQYAGKTTLEFVISDTGVGISEEFMPKLFHTFAQEDATVSNKYGSSGLGLAITKSIVEMMNGNIAVSSVKGKGTTFTVTVTLSDDPSAASSGALKEVHPSEMTVLVIDDDATSREHAKLVLE